jgi:hypothetical protein
MLVASVTGRIIREPSPCPRRARAATRPGGRQWAPRFTRPWTLAFPLMKDDEYRIYEYACHEGNRAVEGILRGARYEERTRQP